MEKEGQQSNNPIELLTHIPFLSFIGSVVFSQIAYNLLNVLLIIRIYNLTHSNLAVSVLVLLALAPQIFFSFPGGIVADAKNKRKILMVGNVLRAIMVLLLLINTQSLIVIWLAALFISIISQFYVPAETPMIPYLIKKNHLFPANSIFGIALYGSVLLGYIAAGPALDLFGDQGVFIFVAILFSLSAVCVHFIPNVTPSIRKLRTEPTFYKNIVHIGELIWIDLGQCLRIIRAKSSLASALLFLSLSQVIILMLATIVPDYAGKTLHLRAEDISLYVFTPAALGVIIASFFVGRLPEKINKMLIMNIGIFLSCATMILLALIDLQHSISILLLSVVVTFFAGVANAFVFIPSQTVLQTEVENSYRAKMYGLLFMLTGLLSLFPIILAGVFADVWGVRAVLIGIAGVLLGIGLASVMFYRRGNRA